MKSCLLITMLCLISHLVSGQMDTCIINLKSAGTDYDQGDYDHAISILNSTLKGCPLSKQDQIQANKLLILCYLGIDNLEAADKTAAAIIKIDPNYTPDKFKDDPKLSALFDKFKPEPTLAMGISGGINFPVIHVDNTYSVVHPDNAPGLASYKSKLGYQFGIEVEKRAYKNLWAQLGFQFRNSIYTHTLDSVQNTTIFYSEKLSYFDFPLSAKYYFFRGSHTPYLVKSFRVFGNIRYIYFPQLVNKSGTRYADDINLYKYYYVDDDFRLDNVQFNIGAYYILSYKVKKVKMKK